MSKTQKIAQCNSNGKLWLTSDILEEVSWEYLAEIELMPDGKEKLHKYLKYADYCLQNQLNKEAFHYYRLVLDKVVNRNMLIQDLREIAKTAYYGIIDLMQSNDEYIWESGSTIIDCYGDLFIDSDDV